MTTPGLPNLEAAGFPPVWWHHHGRKMQVYAATLDVVLISGSAAQIIITKRGPDRWRVDYEITQSPFEYNTGRIVFNRTDMEQAFGLANGFGPGGQGLKKDYLCEVAAQGKFIRHGPHLNIPGPGTRLDGDPNISIEVSEQVRSGIRLFIGV